LRFARASLARFPSIGDARDKPSIVSRLFSASRHPADSIGLQQRVIGPKRSKRRRRIGQPYVNAA